MEKFVVFFGVLLFLFLNLSGCNSTPSPKQPSDISKQPRGISIPPQPPQSPSQPPVKRERVALVIGNGNYQTQSLGNVPVNDALDMVSVLTEQGFSVTDLTDASKAQMEKAITAFEQKLHSGVDGLFYYSGHGVQYAGKNYMIPIGGMSTIHEADDLKKQAVAVNRVTKLMEDAGNEVNIIILDACRNNPFAFLEKGMGTQGLAAISKASGILIGYATGPGEVSLISNGRNSIYTGHLKQLIESQPDLLVESLLKKVRIAVRQDTDGKQKPWYANSLESEFRFSEKPLQ